MDVLEAIRSRRSIRAYQEKPVPRELVEKILEAAAWAPSGHNRQPWRFVVLEGARRRELLDLVRRVCSACREEGHPLESAEWTLPRVSAAPVLVLVYNGRCQEAALESPQTDPVDAQSVAAAVQNMLLAATALGLGSLWVGSFRHCAREIGEWLGRGDQLAAVVALGYADESPEPRPRASWQELTQWLSE